MKNVKDLRGKCGDVFDKLVSGQMDHKTANAANGAVRNIINSLRTQVLYNVSRGTKGKITFLNTD